MPRVGETGEKELGVIFFPPSCASREGAFSTKNGAFFIFDCRPGGKEVNQLVSISIGVFDFFATRQLPKVIGSSIIDD